ncbi:MAG: hypothetical protein ABI818_02535 [Acidobacteriota bacterium]
MGPFRPFVSSEIAWCDPLDARLMVTEHVTMEEAGPGRWTLISVHDLAPADALSLQVVSAPGGQALPVRVLETVPVVVQGAIRYRITLAVIEAPA